MALTGCGFTPAYAPGGAGRALRGRVAIDAPDTREGYALVEQLTKSFGTPTSPAYRLSYRIRTERNSVGITRDQEISRYHITGRVAYTLTEIAGGTPVASGEAQSFTAYSATGSTVASVTAPRDAYSRLMVILADQIVSQILVQTGTEA
ncbi:LPS-assembly lipoprotein [Celeribacter indicus]|nr:LPS-assembly lipoprotein [Celeribacter indicus]